MRAVGYFEPLPVGDENSLLDLDLPRPVARGRDLLVAVEAISLNPKDVKTRATTWPEPGMPRILGWDAAGTVVEAGGQASMFRPGDLVFYAGSGERSGCNAQFQLVDERLVAKRPHSLDAAAASALPLTALTAYEALFHRLEVLRPVPGAADMVVVFGAGGGVGSMAVQLLRALTTSIVVGTASTEASAQRALEMGAHHVVDHSRPLAEQIAALAMGEPGCVLSVSHTAKHLPDIAAFLAPQGRLCLIDDPQSLEIGLLKAKSCSLHWEAVFARSRYQTADMAAQHHALAKLASLVDEGRIQTTMSRNLGPINASNLKEAHRCLEQGVAGGKIVLSGWPEA